MESFTIRVVAPIEDHDQLINAVGIDPAIVGTQMFWCNTSRVNVQRIKALIEFFYDGAIISIAQDEQSDTLN